MGKDEGLLMINEGQRAESRKSRQYVRAGSRQMWRRAWAKMYSRIVFGYMHQHKLVGRYKIKEIIGQTTSP